MKKCKRCGANKPLDDFHKDPKSIDGKWHECKVCWKVRNKRNQKVKRKEQKDFFKMIIG